MYCHGNPAVRIDPDGQDDFYYNSQGEQTKIVERSKCFEFFHGGDRSFITNNDGKEFRLTDQVLGVVKSGYFQGFESYWEISNSKTGFNSLLENATKPLGNENKYSYIFRESKDGGNLDQKKNLSQFKIYGASGKAMNKNEAGNYVWGAVLAKFNISTRSVLILADGGTLWLETISRPNKEGKGWGLNDIGYRLSRARFDEPDEKEAILNGSVKVFGHYINY